MPKPYLKPRYKLTQADRPQLLEALHLWKTLFDYSLDRESLIVWSKAAPHAVVLKAINITHSWVCGRRPSFVLPSDARNYTTGVIRNLLAVRDEAEELLGGAQ